MNDPAASSETEGQPKALPFRETIDTTNPFNRTLISLLHITPEEQLNPDAAPGRKKMARALAQFFRVGAPEILSGKGGPENADTLAKGGIELGALAGIAIGLAPASALALPLGYIALRGISLAAESKKIGGRIKDFLERFFIPKRKQLEKLQKQDRQMESVQKLLHDDILRLQRMRESTRAKGEQVQTVVITEDIKHAEKRLEQIRKYLESNRTQLETNERERKTVETQLQEEQRKLDKAKGEFETAREAQEKNTDITRATELSQARGAAETIMNGLTSRVLALTENHKRAHDLSLGLIQRNQDLETEQTRLTEGIEISYAQREWYHLQPEERQAKIQAERRAVEAKLSSKQMALETVKTQLQQAQVELVECQKNEQEIAQQMPTAKSEYEKLQLTYLTTKDLQDNTDKAVTLAKRKVKDKEQEIRKLGKTPDPDRKKVLLEEKAALQKEATEREQELAPLVAQTAREQRSADVKYTEYNALNRRLNAMKERITLLTKTITELEQTTIPELQAHVATEKMDTTGREEQVRQLSIEAAINRLRKPLSTTTA